MSVTFWSISLMSKTLSYSSGIHTFYRVHLDHAEK